MRTLSSLHSRRFSAVISHILYPCHSSWLSVPVFLLGMWFTFTFCLPNLLAFLFSISLPFSLSPSLPLPLHPQHLSHCCVAGSVLSWFFLIKLLITCPLPVHCVYSSLTVFNYSSFYWVFLNLLGLFSYCYSVMLFHFLFSFLIHP